MEKNKMQNTLNKVKLNKLCFEKESTKAKMSMVESEIAKQNAKIYGESNHKFIKDLEIYLGILRKRKIAIDNLIRNFFNWDKELNYFERNLTRTPQAKYLKDENFSYLWSVIEPADWQSIRFLTKLEKENDLKHNSLSQLGI